MSESSALPQLPEYNVLAGGLSWRHTEFLGALAIPYMDIATKPRVVAWNLHTGRWPILVETGNEIFAQAIPPKGLDPEIIDRKPILPLTFEEIASFTAREIKNNLSTHDITLSPERHPKVWIHVSDFDNYSLEQNVLDLLEVIDIAEVEMAAGLTTQDPETGILYSNQALLGPLDPTETRRIFKEAREQRLTREATGGTDSAVQRSQPSRLQASLSKIIRRPTH